MRSDSAVALSMAEKYTSGSSSLNFLGGELALLAEKLNIAKAENSASGGKAKSGGRLAFEEPRS